MGRKEKLSAVSFVLEERPPPPRKCLREFSVAHQLNVFLMSISPFCSICSSFLPANASYPMASAAAASSYIHSQFGHHQFNGLEMSRVY